MNEISIAVLADNSAEPPFRAEHGFSALIEIPGFAPVLFDTGMGALFDNSKSALVDLSRVSDVVLSHGHYDHTDALSAFAKEHPQVLIHASSEALRPHYSLRTGSCRSIGVSQENRDLLSQTAKDRFIPFTGEDSISGGAIRLAAPIPRLHPDETPSPLLFEDAACSVPDAVPDELVLWMNTAKGLVLVTGCCHAGFINTCNFVRSLSGGLPIRAVIGGFHLAHVPQERLEATAAYIREQRIELVVACHCTGEAETAYLAEHTAGAAVKGYCGMKISL